MQANDMIIDIEFGLRQLSGNRELLYRLLNKFAAEYENLPTRMDTMLTQQDLSSAEILIHTLKGVSGNLGCNRVFEASRTVNEQFKIGEPEQETLNTLFTALNDTLLEINRLTGAMEDAQSLTPATGSQRDISFEALKNALVQHEYINDEKLTGWLNDLQLTPEREQQLIDAISSLDYERAIELMKSTS